MSRNIAKVVTGLVATPTGCLITIIGKRSGRYPGRSRPNGFTHPFDEAIAQTWCGWPTLALADRLRADVSPTDQPAPSHVLGGARCPIINRRGTLSGRMPLGFEKVSEIPWRSRDVAYGDPHTLRELANRRAPALVSHA